MVRSAERFTLFFFGISLTTLFLSDTAARIFSLYFLYLWFDMPMHFLGGVTAALGFHSLPFVVKRISRERRNLIYTVLAVLVISICWEVFEFSIGFTKIMPGFVADTISDLVFDALGAITGYYFVRTLTRLS